MPSKPFSAALVRLNSPYERLVVLPVYHSSTRTLLYVDANPDARRIFELAVHRAKAQFHLYAPGSCDEAMDYLGGRGSYADRARFPLPEAILLDYSLGEHTALNLLSWVRDALALQTEVGIFSVSGDRDQINRFYTAGADYYVVKPAEFESLVRIVSAINRGFHANNKPCLARLVVLPEYRPSRLTSVLIDAHRPEVTN